MNPQGIKIKGEIDIKEEIELKEGSIIGGIERLKEIETMYIKQENEIKQETFELGDATESLFESNPQFSADLVKLSEDTSLIHPLKKDAKHENDEGMKRCQLAIDLKFEDLIKQKDTPQPEGDSTLLDFKTKLYACELCNKTFHKNYQLGRHMMYHSYMRPYECEICDKTYKTQSDLKRHMISHSAERPFSCGECEKLFKTKTEKNRHMISHSAERPFSCDRCEKQFKGKNTLRLHTCHYEGKPSSSEVGDGTSSIHSFNKDPRSKDEEGSKAYTSPCNQKYEDIDVTKTAAETSHKLLPDDRWKQHLSTNSVKRSFLCEVCNNGYESQSELELYAATQFDKKIFVCEICKEYLQTTKALLICDICKKSFRSKSLLKEHLVSHSQERPFTCEVCKHHFKSRKYLTRHVITHSEETPFECDMCQKHFKSKSRLRSHMIFHSEERPFSCEICRKQFKTSRQLVRHKVTHSDEGPLSCEVCQKKLKSRKTLWNHMKSHCKNK